MSMYDGYQIKPKTLYMFRFDQHNLPVHPNPSVQQREAESASALAPHNVYNKQQGNDNGHIHNTRAFSDALEALHSPITTKTTVP